MLATIKFWLPVLVGALVSGCAVSSVNDATGNKFPPRALAAQSGGAQPREVASQPDAGQDQEAVRKVALSYTPLSDPASKSYKIGPRDVLDVTVFQAPELTKTIQVSEAGTINFPLVGEVEAAGKSARELEQELKKKLGTKYLQNPQISIFVKEHFSQRVTMEGAVRRPGLYPIPGGMSLLQAVAEAGGFEENASKEVLLFRQANGKRLAGRFDVSAIREGRAEDPQLEAGDVIIAPTSDIKDGLSWISKLLPLAMLAPYL